MKKILLFICWLIASEATAQIDESDTVSTQYHYNQVYDYEAPDVISYRYKTEELMAFTKKLLGIPYKEAGKDPAGFDCAGFTFYAFRNFGVYLPYFAYEQGETGTEVKMKEAKKGDLIFFQGSNLTDMQIGHVGIVISNKGEKLTWIHAASKGVRIDNIDSPYYNARFVTIRRVAE